MKPEPHILKGIISGIVPLPIKRFYWKNMRPKVFSGAFKNFSEIKDEHPWESEEWIELSRQKLQAIDNLSTEGKPLGGYLSLTAKLINKLSEKETVKVLDFAGGTGFVYFRIFPYLMAQSNVSWHVVDSAALIDIGRKHMTKSHRLSFSEVLPYAGDRFDIVFINTALQYMEDHRGLLKKLLSYHSKYFIFTRLLAGNIETHVTSEIIFKRKTPCRFLKIQDIISFFGNEGFDVLLSDHNREESLSWQYSKDIPSAMRIPYSMDIVFKRR